MTATLHALALTTLLVSASEPRVTSLPPTVQLAICLDTSGSMDGLIEAAKQKLWAIVNDLALAEPTPALEVALLTYGNDGHAPESGWVSVDSGFTNDLDLISQRLFALRTNGGTEFVGRVLKTAGTLAWSDEPDALRLAIVAGNESADQDTESPFRDVCRSLIARGIMVNAIYCGPDADEIAPAWREVARLADGQYASIDKDRGTIVVETPFDAELSTLSAALNATYIPFGARGESGAGNQIEQDGNAASLNGAAAAARAQTKAQKLYHCSWDLVDACSSGSVKLAEVADAELPENMRAMSEKERAAYVESMGTRRAGIQEQIRALGVKRDTFVVAEMKKLALNDDNAFDKAMRRAIREQARSKGMTFPASPEEAAGS